MDSAGYTNFWSFLSEFLPSYSGRDDVLRDDILFRYFTGDDVDEEDLRWIEEEFQNDKDAIFQELVRMETGFANEAITEALKSLQK